MKRLPFFACSLVGLCSLLLSALPASAQMFSYEPERAQTSQSLTVGYYIVDFKFDGTETPDPLLNFDSPIFGIRYARQSFDLSIGYGRQDATATQPELQMLDASLFAWGGIPISGRDSRTQVYIPLLLNSGFRAVGEDLNGSGDLTGELFSFTTVGLGTGLGLETRLSDRVSFSARVTPVLSLTLRSFEGSVGSNRLLDAGAILHLTQLFGGFGLSIGYSFRGQSWDIDGLELTNTLSENVFDYSSTQQMIWVGINF